MTQYATTTVENMGPDSTLTVYNDDRFGLFLEGRNGDND